MSKKIFSIPDIGDVHVYKRKGTKRVSLKLIAGSIKVIQPYWLPYQTGISFVKQHKEWLSEQQNSLNYSAIESGQQIGKYHTIYFIPNRVNRTYVKDGAINVYYAGNNRYDSHQIQINAKKAIKRALILEAKKLIPDRLELLSRNFDYEYTGLVIKPLKTRWGSCSSNQEIKINCYLMMMPWEVIDYVLLHELTHTEYLHHGKDFWDALHKFMPDYKTRMENLKNLQPTVASFQI